MVARIMGKFMLMLILFVGRAMHDPSEWPSCTSDWDENVVGSSATSSSSNGILPPSNNPPSLSRESPAYMTWMAEMWDEEISLGLQEEELEEITGATAPPHASELPLPFGRPDKVVAEPHGRLMDLLCDGRRLRGRPHALTPSLLGIYNDEGQRSYSSSSWECSPQQNKTTDCRDLTNGAPSSVENPTWDDAPAPAKPVYSALGVSDDPGVRGRSSGK